MPSDAGSPDATLTDTGPGEAGPILDIGPLPPNPAAIGPASVLTEHLHANRDGAYVDPTLTVAYASNLHVDANFTGVFDGLTWAETLFVEGLRPGLDAIYVVTNTNHVTAMDAANGQRIWDVVLGPTVSHAALPCVPPATSPVYGSQSTPVIDPLTRTIYVESFQPEVGAESASTETTLVYALSLDDGSIRKGWPVDIARQVKGFNGSFQRTRAGLALVGGTLYIPFASLADCMNYHGWVVGISTSHPTEVSSWSTTADRGGIWGGIVTDGTSLFVTTGNTAPGIAAWGGGEAAIRLSSGLSFSGDSTDYFAPSNWRSMDNDDLDLGSGSPVLFDLPGATPSELLAAIGKEGVLFLLDRTNLGGIGKGNGTTGEGLYSERLTTDGVHGRIATYATAKGRYVVVRGYGAAVGCPNGTAGDLVAARILPTSPPTFTVAWCAVSNGSGSPVVTSTDGQSNPIVWVPGASMTNRLYGFDGDTGAVVYGGGGPGDEMSAISRWESPVIAKGRFYLAGQGRVYALAAKTP